MTRPKRVPVFADEAEERRFWEIHDSTDYVDWSTAELVRMANLKHVGDFAALAIAVAGTDQDRRE